MIILRVEPSLFSALRTGFEAAVCNDDAPIRPQLLSRLRPALADAAATAPRGRAILVRLESIAEQYAPGDCFAVGGEGHPRVTELIRRLERQVRDAARRRYGRADRCPASVTNLRQRSIATSLL